ncbi:MAG: Heme chaperone HemW [Bacteroidetes bacterium]|nr:Heme chaperone HemW [Bacteroidota bacterium]
MDPFLAALRREIDTYASYGDGVVFETVFFGGGTPSLLTPAQLESILSRLHRTFAIASDAEITVETNPGTVTPEKLAAYRSLGVNRLSIGIQSFDEKELQFLSRIHTGREAVECVDAARRAGFTNLSLDLIFSLPGQTAEQWEATLIRAIELNPEHISAYSLIVEDHTPLARMVSSRTVSPNPLEVEAELYERTMSLMEGHCYEHYEVSNYARPGFRSRHNYNYWNHQSYLGFGPSAHSFWKRGDDPAGRRWWNIASLSHYIERLTSGQLPLISEEQVALNELMTERIFLGLRSDGLNVRRFESDFGISLLGTRHALIEDLLRENDATLQSDTLRLTSKGFLLCDEIAERLIV